MNEIRLRTMTEKSILHSHKYQGCSVGMVLAREPKHLAYLYYNITSVNFIPEILDELGITEDIRIAKPGSCGAVFGLWKKGRWKIMGEENYMKQVAHEKVVRRSQAHASERKVSKGSKARHQAFQLNKMGDK